MVVALVGAVLGAVCGAPSSGGAWPGPGGESAKPAASSSGPDTAACVKAYTDAQRLRKSGELKEARQKLLVCSQAECPAVVKADCLPWLDEVDGSLPSIVVAAKGADGKDTTDVKVYVDGQLVAERLDGRPLVVDPGAHQLRFEHGGKPAIEQQIVVPVGVKNRRVDVSFAPEPPPAPTSTAGPDRAPPERGEPIVGYVLTGVGVLALGSFAVFGLVGRAEVDEYQDTCAPTKTCDPDEVSSTETKLLVADISLIVGIAAVGVGVGLILYNKLSDPEPASPSARLDLRPVPGGATGALTVSF